MKNKEFYRLLKKNKLNSNSGFTLIELLIGLFMSIFVIGALGFGLMTVLQTSQRENSKVKARTENSRALDFISDEVRRARIIDTNLLNARVTTSTTDKTKFNVTDTNINLSTGAFNSDTTTKKKIVFALDIPEVTSSSSLDADNNVSTPERIIYFLKSSSGTNWKGPSVLYRWGPPLGADGNYTAGDWTEQALIDGIDDTHIAASPCAPTGEILTPPRLAGTAPTLTGTALSTFATGFHACINGANTAQLFLTGQTKTASGVNDDSQTNDSKVVARARTRAANTTNTFSAVSWSVKGLGGKYECNRNTSPAPTWDMRTDFGSNSANPDDTTKWIQDSDDGKQPQPIEVDSRKPLLISSSAIGATGCNSLGNEGKDGSEALSTYTETLSHTLNFANPYTFNGDRNDATVHNESQVDVDKEGIRFLKKGEIPPYGGYEANPGTSSPDDQPSLGKFLYDKKMAIIDPNNTTVDNTSTPLVDERLTNPLTKFIIPTDQQLTDDTNLTAAEKDAFVMLGDDQRIVAIEMGQEFDDKNNDLSPITGNKNPGFDLQDNIFVVTSDAFSQKYASTTFVPYDSTP
jgi:type II secretory pathway pseudopilin PulG